MLQNSLRHEINSEWLGTDTDSDTVVVCAFGIIGSSLSHLTIFHSIQSSRNASPVPTLINEAVGLLLLQPPPSVLMNLFKYFSSVDELQRERVMPLTLRDIFVCPSRIVFQCY
jgi:hypothetical protein